MFLLIVLFSLCGACFCSVTVPSGIEKISGELIRNGSSYYHVRHFGVFLHVHKYVYPDLTNPTNNYNIFDSGNYPLWADPGQGYLQSDINVIGEKMVRVFFDAIVKSTSYQAIGVAFDQTLDPLST